ncbi:MAG TPA: cupredoxin domain-containing protein [Methylovirgula sp.]|nr:cupredoxin domain-containing protein [Methylovirgula sp.]
MQIAGRAQMLFLSVVLSGGLAGAALADPIVVEFHDGKLSPVRIEVPASSPVKIELNNTGKTPAEFESHKLHVEKVVVPHSKSVITLRPLDPGQYDYFDDFHEDAPKGLLIAK